MRLWILALLGLTVIAMPPRRSDAERQEVEDFVRHLMSRANLETDVAFAAKAGVHWASLSDWKTGKSIPDGLNLLRLVRASGVLDAKQAVHVRPQDAGDDVLDQALEEIAGVLERLVTRVSERERPPDAATSRKR